MSKVTSSISPESVAVLRAGVADRGDLLRAASCEAYRLVRTEARSAASVARASRLSGATIGRYVALAPIVESVTRTMGADTEGLSALWTSALNVSKPVDMLLSVAGMAPASYADARTALLALDAPVAPVAPEAPVSGPSDGSGTAGALTDGADPKAPTADQTDPGTGDVPDAGAARRKAIDTMAARIVALATDDTDGRLPSDDAVSLLAAMVAASARAMLAATVDSEVRKRADAADRAAVVEADRARRVARLAEQAARLGVTVAA